MARGTRGSAFDTKISGLERAKDQNPFASGGAGFSLPSNYKETEAAAFTSSGANISDYYKPSKGTTTKFEKGDSGGFLDDFKEGIVENLKKAQEGKSDTDKLLDFARETRGMQGGAQFGGMESGLSTEVAEGLNVYNPPSTQQMFIPGQQGQPGFFGRMAGQILGGAAGAVGAGLGKAAIGMLCDIRAKEDIAPLNKVNIEINDDLSECAYFVKDLQTGMFG